MRELEIDELVSHWDELVSFAREREEATRKGVPTTARNPRRR